MKSDSDKRRNLKKLTVLFAFLLFGSNVFAASTVRSISMSELSEKIHQKIDGKIYFVLVDLRNEVDYMNGHLPGAINLPVSKHVLSYDLISKKDREVVFYGYSSNDRAAMNTPMWAISQGLSKIYLLEGGFKGWSGDIEK